MIKEREEAETFCRDFFGTTSVVIDGQCFIAVLAGYLGRVKVELLKKVYAKDESSSVVWKQLELFEQQGITL